MYGEEDQLFLTVSLQLAKTGGRCLLLSGGGRSQTTYVGNVAWLFVCAETAMLNDNDNEIGGNAFFAADDSPLSDMIKSRALFLKACNVSKIVKIPFSVMIYIMYFIYFIFSLLSLIWRSNIPAGVEIIKQIKYHRNFKSDKAKMLLDYSPLYSYEESFGRSMMFYKKYSL